MPAAARRTRQTHDAGDTGVERRAGFAFMLGGVGGERRLGGKSAPFLAGHSVTLPSNPQEARCALDCIE